MSETTLSPKEIVARVAKVARGLTRVGVLVDELAERDALGNATMAGETVRTLDDLAGFYEGGRFYGGREIAAAMRHQRHAGQR